MPIRKILLTVVMLLTAAAIGAQEGGDTQAQIDYAYQTEDGNRLANLIQNLTARVKDNSADIALRYHLAHAQYRFGQLSGERHAHAAEAAFSDCIDELKPAIDTKDVKSVESMVLQSACYSGLAQQDLRHAKPGSPEGQRGFAELRSAAELFEQSSGTSNDAPGWGHAEAYLALGRELQNRGDHLGARNWIEKALIAAPDFKMAQRQLASLAGH
jgi:tetratricopeptide (TPR) repeat protein